MDENDDISKKIDNEEIFQLSFYKLTNFVPECKSLYQPKVPESSSSSSSDESYDYHEAKNNSTSTLAEQQELFSLSDVSNFDVKTEENDQSSIQYQKNKSSSSTSEKSSVDVKPEENPQHSIQSRQDKFSSSSSSDESSDEESDWSLESTTVQKKVIKWKENMNCRAICNDELYSEAKIIEVSGDTVTIRFFGSGIEQNKNKSELRRSEGQASIAKQLSLHLHMDEEYTENSAVETKQLLEIYVGCGCRAKADDGKYQEAILIEIYDNDRGQVQFYRDSKKREVELSTLLASKGSKSIHKQMFKIAMAKWLKNNKYIGDEKKEGDVEISEKWKVGSNCRARYHVDDLYYEAKIVKLVDDNSARIRYYGFDNEETVQLSKLRQSEGAHAIVEQLVDAKYVSIVDENEKRQRSQWAPGMSCQVFYPPNDLIYEATIQEVTEDRAVILLVGFNKPLEVSIDDLRPSVPDYRRKQVISAKDYPLVYSDKSPIEVIQSKDDSRPPTTNGLKTDDNSVISQRTLIEKTAHSIELESSKLNSEKPIDLNEQKSEGNSPISHDPISDGTPTEQATGISEKEHVSNLTNELASDGNLSESMKENSSDTKNSVILNGKEKKLDTAIMWNNKPQREDNSRDSNAKINKPTFAKQGFCDRLYNNEDNGWKASVPKQFKYNSKKNTYPPERKVTYSNSLCVQTELGAPDAETIRTEKYNSKQKKENYYGATAEECESSLSHERQMRNTNRCSFARDKQSEANELSSPCESENSRGASRNLPPFYQPKNMEEALAYHYYYAGYLDSMRRRIGDQ